ncbi:MAG: signal peptidase I [Candidatus Gracilibacteria bacterium]
MEKEKIKKIGLWILDLAINVAIVFGIVLLVEKFLVTPFDIYGPSMCDNLNLISGECEREYGEKVIINKAGYYVSDPERGDIIIFKPKFSDEKYFVKRIIGLPGETVEILDGEVYITNDENPTGKKLDESYLNITNKHNTRSFSKGFKIFQVPEGEYFVLGDNREASTDSRSCFKNPFSEGCDSGIEDAFVPKENIAGKASLVFWPIGSMRMIEQPEY